jgi:CPA1 family monovalent cation:H+ antiporter
LSVDLSSIELVFVILVVAIALSYVARWIHVADPIVLLLGGIVLGLVPGLPPIELEPDLVFVLFLPPILFSAAYFTPIRDFKANGRPILLLAIGLVLFTTVVVGLVANALVPGMGLAAALTLGAIVAPPDAVAATAVFRRLGVPRRLVTILEGESLINDASSLILYRVASAVALGLATFSIADASIAFVVLGIGGILVGVVIGLAVTKAIDRTRDPLLEVIVSLVAPMAAYLGAELVGVSGVLATVTAGLIMGRRGARILSPEGRLLGTGVWSAVIWAINAFVFMLIGLQLPSILAASLTDHPPAELLGLGVAISATVILTRMVWVFPATYIPRWLSARIREREAYPPPRAVFIVSWAGMRGVVSLAAALALATDFPQRDLILFLTFCVILATLVGQGLTLPWLIRRLGIVAGDLAANEEAHARLAAVEAALRRLDTLVEDYPDHLPLIEQLRTEYDHEATHIATSPSEDGQPTEAEREQIDHRAIRSAVILAEREAVIQLRDDGVINDQTLRRIELDLDLEAVRAGV